MKWENKDWFWLLAIIIYACGFSFLYKAEVLNVISYVSTFISTALGGVAIYISIREATKTEKVKEDINFILGEMKEKIGQVDSKVSSLDIQTISKTIDEKMNDVIHKFKTQIDNQGDVLDKNAIKNMLENELNKKASEIKDDINEVVFDNKYSPQRMVFHIFLEHGSNYDFRNFVMQAREILGVPKDMVLFKKLSSGGPVASIQASIKPGCNLTRYDILNAFNSLKEVYNIASIE